MQTVRDLYNLGLSVVGHAASVSDPEENSQAAALCRLWFNPARRSVFSAFHWSSIRNAQRLARAKTRDAALDWQNTDPWPGYEYAFALPGEMIQPQYLADFSRFEIGNVGDERLLFTNNPNPLLFYSRDTVDPTNWSPDLYMALAYALGASFSFQKNGKDNSVQRLEQKVQSLIDSAATQAANEVDTYFEAIPQSWAGTGFSTPAQSVRYYYPTSTFQVAGL